MLEEEKQEFSFGKFNFEDLQKFRQQNKTFQELENFKKQNLSNYEIFAVWTEKFLSERLDVQETFDRKCEKFPKEEKEQIDKIIHFDKEYGDLATFYSFGLARRTNKERASRILEDIFKEKIREIKFAVLYGSKKPFSDIDILAVSDNLPSIKLDWLDLRAYSQLEFESLIKFFDISAADPIINGEFLIGDEDYLNNQKKMLLEQPITEHAISYNLIRSEEQKRFGLQNHIESQHRKKGLDYSLTYLKNAQALKEGKRIFTKKELISNSEDLNLQESIIERRYNNDET